MAANDCNRAVFVLECWKTLEHLLFEFTLCLPARPSPTAGNTNTDRYKYTARPDRCRGSSSSSSVVPQPARRNSFTIKCPPTSPASFYNRYIHCVLELYPVGGCRCSGLNFGHTHEAQRMLPKAKFCQRVGGHTLRRLHTSVAWVERETNPST